jgi:hypothetical protein
MLASNKGEQVITLVQATRRQFIQAVGAASLLTLLSCDRQDQTMVTLYTFGDSILDCGRYNEFGVHPGQLLVQNDDRLFPEFQGQDLVSRGSARLEHRARDGATVLGLLTQTQKLRVESKAIALITIGGNDLLSGLIVDTGAGITAFAKTLDNFVWQLPIRPVLLGNVYDPTLGDDRRNFLGVEAAIARKNFQRMNTLNFIGNSFLARQSRAKKLFLTPKTLFPIKSIDSGHR